MTINYQQLTEFRRQLHAHPEVSGLESKTARKIQEWLQTCQPDELITQVGGHGILAVWDSGQKGPTVLFRAELDALPIQETNTFDYQSQAAGVSHKCGHDGHSTILCGLAQTLSIQKPSSGRVVLLFQPAEENGEGAKAMLADSRCINIQPDYVFALHNLPGYPMGHVIVKDHTFTAAVNSIIIRLQGKTSHAAEPEHGINPASAMADILKASLLLANNHPEQTDMRVITPVFLEMGEKSYGVSAGQGAVHLTLRCWDDTQLRQLEAAIEALSAQIAAEYGLKVTFEYTQTFSANQNAPEAALFVRQAADAKGLPLEERSYPFKWGEDFGLFTARFTGCMFGLGAGENTPALHNPDYDFPDALIENGVSIFSGIIDQIHVHHV